VKAMLNKDYSKETILKPLMQESMNVLIELHGWEKNYTGRIDGMIMPLQDVKHTFVGKGCEFGPRIIGYSFWKKRHYNLLKNYDEAEKRRLYGNPNFKIKREWVQTINRKNYRMEFHYGLDINNHYNDNVIACADGKVYKTGYTYSGGRYIITRHWVDGKLYHVYYGHLSTIDVEKGDIVKQGEKIGVLGDTGITTGQHLHWAVYEWNNISKYWTAVNPTCETSWYENRVVKSKRI
jgi:murein DD-endopeptidase MepM/ murein hydrolase activator NlpD